MSPRELMSLHYLDLPADRVEGEVVAALFFEDERPLRGPEAILDWRLNGLLTGMLVKGEAMGRRGEHLLFPNNGKLGADRALFAGGGHLSSLKNDDYLILIRGLLSTCRRAGFSRIALALRALPDCGEEALRRLVHDAVEEMQGGVECLLTVGGTSRISPLAPAGHTLKLI